MQIIILDDKYSLISMIMSYCFFNWFILEARAEIQKKIVRFLVQMKTLALASEVYWPLAHTKTNNKFEGENSGFVY